MERDPERRAEGLDVMARVYGWPSVGDGTGDFFAYTAEHLFADIWTRPGLTWRDRRLLLIGLLVGRGLHDVADLQIESAMANDEIDDEQLREIVIFLAHYAGWPSAAKLHVAAETLIAKRATARRAEDPPAAEPPIAAGDELD